MFVSRRKYERDMADMRDQREQLRAQRDMAARDRDAYQAAARTAARQFAEADAANKRLYGRNRTLNERLEASRDALGVDSEYVGQLEQRLARALRACTRYRAELVTAPTRLHTPLIADLRRSEQARRSLDEQMRTLQAANEAMTRELKERS
jgi:chromosome segregation ATPase